MPRTKTAKADDDPQQSAAAATDATMEEVNGGGTEGKEDDEESKMEGVVDSAGGAEATGDDGGGVTDGSPIRLDSPPGSSANMVTRSGRQKKRSRASDVSHVEVEGIAPGSGGEAPPEKEEKEEGEEGAKKKARRAESPSAPSAEGASPIHRVALSLAHRLRPPSQRTPGGQDAPPPSPPISANNFPVPPPPRDGRRLDFGAQFSMAPGSPVAAAAATAAARLRRLAAEMTAAAVPAREASTPVHAPAVAFPVAEDDQTEAVLAKGGEEEEVDWAAIDAEAASRARRWVLRLILPAYVAVAALTGVVGGSATSMAAVPGGGGVGAAAPATLPVPILVERQSAFLARMYGFSAGEKGGVADVDAVDGRNDTGVTDGADEEDYEDEDEDEDEDKDEDTSEEQLSQPPPPEEIVVYVTDPALLERARGELRAIRKNDQLAARYAELESELRRAAGKIAEALDGIIPPPSAPSPTESAAKVADDALRAEIKAAAMAFGRREAEMEEWERALEEAEEAMADIERGDGDVASANAKLVRLAAASPAPFAASAFDARAIRVPGEGCGGRDYFPLPASVIAGGIVEEKEDDEGEEEQVGGERAREDAAATEFAQQQQRRRRRINPKDLDSSSDAPVHREDAEAVREVLSEVARLTAEALIGGEGGRSDSGSSAAGEVEPWLRWLVERALEKGGLDQDAAFGGADAGDDNDIFADAAEILAKKGDEFRQRAAAAAEKAESKAKALTSGDASYSVRNVQDDIDRLLEIEDADRTGQFDYASSVMGARIVRRGPHATSPSLVESLPLLNRVLAQTALRFYGHPSEAAILPTRPPAALGQCWSFGPEAIPTRGTVDPDSVRGKYATLTVALAEPAKVTGVAVEHPPAIATQNPGTAIRDFRVIGYEDSGATGEPWELGTFQFSGGVKGRSNLQEFRVASSVDGYDVPKFRSVTLAIDSNWDADFSCLYRFRVHGV